MRKDRFALLATLCLESAKGREMYIYFEKKHWLQIHDALNSYDNGWLIFHFDDIHIRLVPEFTVEGYSITKALVFYNSFRFSFVLFFLLFSLCKYYHLNRELYCITFWWIFCEDLHLRPLEIIAKRVRPLEILAKRVIPQLNLLQENPLTKNTPLALYILCKYYASVADQVYLFK